MRHPISRRRFLAGTAAAGAAAHLRPAFAAGPSGTLVVAADTRAAQPQPGHRRLERRLLRREQGDRAAGRDGLRRRRPRAAPRDGVGGIAGRAQHPLHAARGRRPGTTASRSPRPTSPSRRCRSGSRCRISAAWCSSDLEAVDTPDARTAIFRFSTPDSVPARPQCPAGADRGAAAATSTRARTSSRTRRTRSSSAPARSASSSTGRASIYRLERNPAYWETGRPCLDGIVYRVLPDRAADRRGARGDQIQLAAFSAVPLADLARIGKVPGIRVIPEGYEGITYQLDGRDQPSPQGARRRRACAAPSRTRSTASSSSTRSSSATPRPRPARSRTSTRSSTTRTSRRRPSTRSRANALLDEAGYPRGAGGTRFQLRLLPAPWFEQTRQFGDYLRQALRAVGIDAQIVNNDAAAHTKAVYTDHAFDLAVGSPVYRNDPAISTTILYQGGLPAGVPFSNQYGYDSAAMNDIIAQAAVATDDGERIAPLQAISRRSRPRTCR